MGHAWGRRKLLSLAGALAILLGGSGFVFYLSATKGEDSTFRVNGAVPASGQALASALYQSLGVRMLPGHHVSVLDNGQVFDAIVEQIGQARSSVHIVMYIWEKGAASDRVVSALKERAHAGVTCRIVVDDLGSPDFEDTLKPELAKAGCHVFTFRPLPGGKKLARNHRKILIVDGVSALTGGLGVRDNWLGDGVHEDAWRDTSVLFTGPAVSDAQQAFAENWQEAGGALLPEDAFPTQAPSGSAAAAFVSSTGGTVTRAERLTQLSIASAQRRLWIANAYFVPSRGIMDLLVRKAREGVDIRILAPGKNSDSKTAFGAQHVEYGTLLQHGVQVWEYTASMMHSKTMVVDDALATIGSINLDPLSLSTLEDAALLIEDRATATRLAESFVADCARSKRLSPK